MMTIVVVGLLVMVLFGGAALAFAFGPDESKPSAPRQVTTASPPIVLFQPTAWSAAGKPVAVDTLVAELERHLRAEQQAASNFARDPSHRTLWSS
ncbi:MAG: hypothetical protein IT371_04945 [Deltaproteobacteria bacterium]|nr:hypothetical protein [Deltaproteobacteria bacterium]